MYSIRRKNRGESLEYSDENGIYEFNAIPYKGIWTVSLIYGTGKNSIENNELTDAEKEIVIPRIKEFIESKRQFPIFWKRYEAKFVHDPENYPKYNEKT